MANILTYKNHINHMNLLKIFNNQDTFPDTFPDTHFSLTTRQARTGHWSCREGFLG